MRISKISPAPKNPAALKTAAAPGAGGGSEPVGALSETGQGKRKRGTALDALDPYIPGPGQWSLIPGSSIVPVLPTEAELGADFCEQIRCHRALSVLRAWNAIGYDEVNHCLWALAGGGHTDYGGNETYRYCLGTPLTGWERITEPAPLTRMVSTNPNCLAPAHGPMSSHTYDGVTWLPGTSKFFWLGAVGFCGRGMGPDSAWIFDSDTASWVELPHLRQYARYARTGIDPLNGNILVFTSNTLRAIDPTSRQLKWATRPIGKLGDGTAIVHVQRREIYLLVTRRNLCGEARCSSRNDYDPQDCELSRNKIWKLRNGRARTHWRHRHVGRKAHHICVRSGKAVSENSPSSNWIRTFSAEYGPRLLAVAVPARKGFVFGHLALRGRLDVAARVGPLRWSTRLDPILCETTK